MKLAFLEVVFPESRLFELFLLCGPIIYIPDELCQSLFLFRSSLWDLTAGNNFMVMNPVVSEILGGGDGGFPPSSQMPVSCKKEQMPLPIK